ncbi:MAG: LbtU family siderophore porin [Thermodesulfobacteriota bacterium]|nr:LbtU family siderophore porin [Thermodesulfobacteriota bacterium]
MKNGLLKKAIVGLGIVCMVAISPVWANSSENENSLENIFQNVTFSGLIEAEATATSDFEGTDESDIALATVELGFDSPITQWGSGHVLLAWDDGDDKITVDEAIITIGNSEKTPVYLSVGRMYVPFGNFETNMISDTFTLFLGETQEDAAQVGFETNGFYGSMYVFNGDTNEETNGDSEIEQFGTNIGYAIENDNFSLDVNAGYINSLLDSNELQDALTVEGHDYIGGLDIAAVLNFNAFTLIGEYLTALDDYETGSEKYELKAYNIELGYTFDISGKETTIAAGYQGSDDCAAYLPETRLIGAISVAIMDGMSLSLEYAYDDDYDENEGGTGEDADSITAQIAYEF